MAGTLLRGAPAAPGVALGPTWRLPEAVRTGALVAWEDHDRERDCALEALAGAARALDELAATLPADEAAIVEAGALMAHDPALVSSIEEGILARGQTAAEAILAATEKYADAIASIGDEMLAARADDVRSLGRRAARLSTDGGSELPPGNDLIMIATDLGPADVAELAPSLAGVALVAGGPTAHAAIVARSLGIPMVTGLGESVLAIENGIPLALDGATGLLTIDPAESDARRASQMMRTRREARAADQAERDRPAVTSDGRRIVVLANVASRSELELALTAGAEGVGLLRTELTFLDAPAWPVEREHAGALEPVLGALGDDRAVVRVLDFGADKAPPFLKSVPQRGIELLLDHPDALLSQLRAIVTCGRGRDVRVLLPMVDACAQVSAVREMLTRIAAELGTENAPPLGAMIETPLAADIAAELASVCDFLSIGTNDLTATTLGADRFAANQARAHDPRVLSAIARTVAAAHQAGLAIEVCGEAASDPLMLVLLVGLGVDELSVGAARVGEVRRWVRGLSATQATEVALRALALDSADDVERLVAPMAAALQSAQTSNGHGERIERSGRIHALGS